MSAAIEEGEVVVTLEDSMKYIIQQLSKFAPQLVEPVLRGYMQTIIANYGLPEEYAEEVMNNQGFTLKESNSGADRLAAAMQFMDMEES